MRHAPGSLVSGLLALAVALALAAGCSGGGSSPDGLPWSADFSSGNDRDGFSNPDGSETGNCSRAVRDGVAVYTWESATGVAGHTRCYPVEHFSRQRDGGWEDPVTGPWVMTGRFRATLPDPRSLTGQTFSLITILPSAPVSRGDGPGSWLSSTTVNVVWDGALGQAVLNLYHVPAQGRGEFDRVRPVAFPFGEWVDIRVEWGADNSIRVFQDGTLIIRARKDTVPDAEGAEVPLGQPELHAVHFGGYASEAVTGWTIENDDLAIRPAT